MVKGIFIVIFVIAAIIVGPLLTIWALNTLFPVLNIPYNVSTWAAAFILAGIFSSHFSTNKD